MLRLATAPLRAFSGAAARTERLLETTADLVDHVDDLNTRVSAGSHASIMSFRSVYSVLSWFSAGSVLSVGSAGSFGSIASAGSLFSVLSAGSILSLGSAGSLCAIGSTGSAFAIGGTGQLGPRARRAVRTSGTLLAVAALASAARPGR